MGKSKPDYIFLGIVVTLVILGILILASASAPFGQKEFGDPYYFLWRQLLYGLIPGIILGLLAFKIPLSLLKKWIFPLLLINLLFLALVFVPGLGLTLGGATRWIDLGFVSFQPAEFFKLFFLIYLAAWLAGRQKKQQNFTLTLLPFLIIVGITAVLIAKQPDISTLGIIIIAASIVYFGAGTPLWHSILIASVGIAGLIFLMTTAPYRLDRLLVFLHPGADPLGIGYHIKQALIAVGSGGIFGLGLGMSLQKFGFLPQPISDSIFAIFAEETGFIGSLILISLFLIFFWRGFKISKEAKDKFSQLAALGITSWISLQAFINIGSMIGILPLTGIPLPFISYGGSHIIAELIGIGILLNISRNKL